MNKANDCFEVCPALSVHTVNTAMLCLNYSTRSVSKIAEELSVPVRTLRQSLYAAGIIKQTVGRCVLTPSGVSMAESLAGQLGVPPTEAVLSPAMLLVLLAAKYGEPSTLDLMRRDLMEATNRAAQLTQNLEAAANAMSVMRNDLDILRADRDRMRSDASTWRAKYDALLDRPDALGYIVWCPESSQPPKVVHKTRAAADKVAHDMAQRYHGQRFHVCIVSAGYGIAKRVDKLTSL